MNSKERVGAKLQSAGAGAGGGAEAAPELLLWDSGGQAAAAHRSMQRGSANTRPASPGAGRGPPAEAQTWRPGRRPTPGVGALVELGTAQVCGGSRAGAATGMGAFLSHEARDSGGGGHRTRHEEVRLLHGGGVLPETGSRARCRPRREAAAASRRAPPLSSARAPPRDSASARDWPRL